MPNRHSMLTILCSFLAVVLISGVGEINAAKKPNVLFISIDDLNDWVGCLGGHPQAKTPNIDRLAKRGVLFTNAHCQAPVCAPSRTTLMTGQLPSSTGLYFLRESIKDSDVTRSRVTLVEHFAANGYATFGAGKVYHGDESEGRFQEYGGNFGGFGPRPKKKIAYPQGHPLWDWGAFPEKDSDMPDRNVADWCIARIKQKQDKPFFVGVGIYRPHVPMYAPHKWLELHPLEKVKLPVTINNDQQDVPAYGRDLTIGLPAPRHKWFIENEQRWKHAVQSYLASATFADDCVGRVLDALDNSPAKENTVIVLFSDHGWHLGEKQRWAKRSLWENSTRVPMIVSVPGRKAGICSKPVGLVDLFPTLIEICGLPSVAGLDGNSLKPLIANQESEWSHAAITTFGPNNHSVRSENWRYIRYADGSEELYDHTKDPHEHDNLLHNRDGAAAFVKVVAEHRTHLPKVNRPTVKNAGGYGHRAWQAAEVNATKRRAAD